jgi:hypothetical protein
MINPEVCAEGLVVTTIENPHLFKFVSDEYDVFLQTPSAGSVTDLDGDFTSNEYSARFGFVTSQNAVYCPNWYMLFNIQ